MSKITPGPWDFEEADQGYGLVISPPEEYEGLWFTAIVHCVDPLTRTANARAISAVPEMMAALEKCVEHLRCIRDGYSSLSPEDIGRAALAKARGETP